MKTKKTIICIFITLMFCALLGNLRCNAQTPDSTDFVCFCYDGNSTKITTHVIDPIVRVDPDSVIRPGSMEDITWQQTEKDILKEE